MLAALRLLECFETDEGLRAVDLRERTGLQYSRIMRLAGTLASRGFLYIDADTGRYFLGPGLFRIGQLLKPRYDDLASSVRPILSTLVAETGKTAMFSVTDGISRLVLCKREPSSALRYTVSEGQSRPIESGASGRVILAFGGDALRAQVLAAMDESERPDFEARLTKVRACGYDVSVSELTQDAFAVACPALTAEGDLIGALTLAGPSSSLSEEMQAQYVALLQQQATLITRPSASAKAS
ncbi:IclR family transcriptional regulator [Pseudoruegeria sp. HB172150]|uniref:IclR family transcriptional regulator n=1 Tax=Pseudoruegeria sp. HB172150 TaxID=2721164 RepID=UPI0015557FC8